MTNDKEKKDKQVFPETVIDTGQIICPHCEEVVAEIGVDITPEPPKPPPYVYEGGIKESN